MCKIRTEKHTHKKIMTLLYNIRIYCLYLVNKFPVGDLVFISLYHCIYDVEFVVIFILDDGKFMSYLMYPYRTFRLYHKNVFVSIFNGCPSS